ncbi:MAG: 30S ribosomal protein S9 [Dehalococcoidia bacterium]|mgnify:FL=1|nr:30S ribosomal protein S9 [Chloroflexota bacterium]MBP05405.1 30S ribosomal protein S9 [Chloroflexota bacterium]OUW95906.1 MAG: 30S ribosomal protein S9 [Chloroflexi bacterium TMED230]RZP13103.1 MAG: 30S ribosomal protein S9 [Chloroflexota bacterium]
MTTKKTYYYGTGKRKSSIARVKIFNTNGKIQVNGKTIKEVLLMDDLVNIALLPLKITDKEKISAEIKIQGGGASGQSGAISLGIARALCEMDIELRPKLKSHGLLTRDSRVKESKKYGLKKARKAPQYTKR